MRPYLLMLPALVICTPLLPSDMNCRYPKNGVERVVCADPELQKGYGQIDALFNQALASFSEVHAKRILEVEQVRWLDGPPYCATSFRPTAQDVACMKQKFSDRMAVLDGYLSKPKQVDAV